MLDKQDIALLQGMFDKQELKFDKKLNDVRDELCDRMDGKITAAIHASEGRMLRRMTAMETRIINGVNELISDTILPQIEELRLKCA